MYWTGQVAASTAAIVKNRQNQLRENLWGGKTTLLELINLWRQEYGDISDNFLSKTSNCDITVFANFCDKSRCCYCDEINFNLRNASNTPNSIRLEFGLVSIRWLLLMDWLCRMTNWVVLQPSDSLLNKIWYKISDEFVIYGERHCKYVSTPVPCFSMVKHLRQC